MKKMKMDDDFQEYLIEGAVFDGDQDIPCMLTNGNYVIPKKLVPYTERKKVEGKNVYLHCFIHDFKFSSLITDTKNHIKDFAKVGGIICPDPTLSIGGSKTINQAQVYFSRAVGFYLQKNGVNAIPCIRWGDPSTYEYCFLGVPKDSIIAISTHGCIMPSKNNNNLMRNTFSKGLPKMLETLSPRCVIVYGRMPNDIFGKYLTTFKFINFKSELEERVSRRLGGDA